MKHRSIGLLNVQYADNYGANLIAYAMERTVDDILEGQGTIQTIDYCPDLVKMYSEANGIKNSYLQYGFRKAANLAIRQAKAQVVRNIRQAKLLYPLKAVYQKVHTGSKSIDETATYDCDLKPKRLENFEKFRKNHLNRTSKCTNVEFSTMGFDTIVVGSDVVWKPQRLLSKEVKNAYFLSFPGKLKRVAYAASLGISDKKEMHRLRHRYKKAIEPFDAISIRESSGAAYIQSLFSDRKVYNCIDPVFLRSRSEYEKLIEDEEISVPYIYAYILGDNPVAYKYVERLSREKNLRILYHISPGKTLENGESVYSDGPVEFLKRIKNACYIVTDSFHGTAFAIIFCKQFFSFTRGILSVRLDNFLAQIGLSSRLLSTTTEKTDIDAPIAYDKVWSVLNNWVETSTCFLRNALKSREET